MFVVFRIVSKCKVWPLIFLNKAVHMLTLLLRPFVILVNYEVGMMQDKTVLKSKNFGLHTVSGGPYVFLFPKFLYIIVIGQLLKFR